MYDLITCKYEMDLVKNSLENSFTHYKSMGIFSDAQGQLTLQTVVWSGRISNSFELLCMPSRKSGNIDFLDAQGQVTLWSGVGSGRILNSSKLLCMPPLPASMKESDQKQLKMWQHHLSHYKVYGDFFRR